MLNFARAHGIGNDSGTGGQPHDYNEQPNRWEPIRWMTSAHGSTI